MSYLSPEFGLLLALSLALFGACPAGGRATLLLVLSYLFYLTYEPAYAGLLLATTAVAYGAALAIERVRGERAKLAVTSLAVAALIGLLATLKWLPVRDHDFIVPLGLSYYLFKLVGYLLDVHWGIVPARRSFTDVALYAAFFPQIVSGPIQRAGDFFAQLPRLGRFEPAQVSAGLRRILLGAFKKLVIAQRLGMIVDPTHTHPEAFSPLELLLSAYLFAFQLYADFSGLTDIAIGTGQLFGIVGPENFNLPFHAPNLQEYWRRWHMSLTSWLSDYLFQPLRLSLRRFGQFGLIAAILINMVAVGVWHGPRWTYAVFGAIHGIMLAGSVLTLRARDRFFRRHARLARLRSIGAPLITFHLAVFPLVIFRSPSLSSAAQYFQHLLPAAHAAISPWRLSPGFLRLGLPTVALVLIGLAAAESIDWLSRRRPAFHARFLAAPWPVRWSVYYAGVAAVFLSAYGAQQFLYAQF